MAELADEAGLKNPLARIVGLGGLEPPSKVIELPGGPWAHDLKVDRLWSWQTCWLFKSSLDNYVRQTQSGSKTIKNIEKWRDGPVSRILYRAQTA